MRAYRMFKVDILSNRALSHLWGISARHVYEYPSTDDKTRLLLQRGDVFGILFCESPAMRKALRVLQPASRRELALALALIRPAAKGARRLSRADLSARQDLFVFDDDASHFLKSLLGCSEAEAEVLRKQIVKGQRGKDAEPLQALESVLAVRNLSATRIREVVQAFEHVGQYSFCKSHAMGYAHLCWALAYEKAHHPHRFWQEHRRAVGQGGNTVYRPWVYRREAIIASNSKQLDVLSVNHTGGLAVGGQKTLRGDPVSELEQYKLSGWWQGEQFMPDCFVRPMNSTQSWDRSRSSRCGDHNLLVVADRGGMKDEEDEEEEEDLVSIMRDATAEGAEESSADLVEFRGLLACGRRYKGQVLFVTIGVANGVFLDLSFSHCAAGGKGATPCTHQGQTAEEGRMCGSVRRVDLSRVAFVEGRGRRKKQRGAEWVECAELLLRSSAGCLLYHLALP